jgi:hypothetical protein
MNRKINCFGLAGGISTLLLIVISMFIPWWQFTIGNPVLLQANTSPLNTNFDFLSSSAFTVPLLWALNFASALSLAAGGIIMVIYSLYPSKSYSMRLLSFSYRKPLYAVVFFVFSLVTLTLIIQGLIGISVPLMGSAVVTLPQSITQIVIIHMNVTANFLWPFWFAVAASILCLAARIYHKKVIATQLPLPSAPVN